MEIIWTPQAEQDRDDIWEYIASENPVAAARIDGLFSEAAATLLIHPKVGKPGVVKGTRELTKMRDKPRTSSAGKDSAGRR